MYFNNFGKTALFSLTLCLGSAALLSGCASETSYKGPSSAGPGSSQYLRFSLTVNANGRIDTEENGYYAILLNSEGNTIEATDSDTFTDFIRFDGINFDWYTRQANLPNTGFTFNFVGTLNPEGSISSNGRTINIIIDAADSATYLNQYIAGDTFTAQAITTDRTDDSYLGRIIDHMGDNLDTNSLQTLSIDKFFGVLNPLPTFYPNDYLNDWISHSDDLGADFPYVNFDIDTFEIYSEQR